MRTLIVLESVTELRDHLLGLGDMENVHIHLSPDGATYLSGEGSEDIELADALTTQVIASQALTALGLRVA